ncbi:hypothetical protein, partial [Pseudomonas sp. NCHU5232]|uniref:hypothetical protein n=1 Tax=Pseudomonas sp. NCHU5232 TaxID=3451356 RepID=UPI003F94AD51
MDLLLFSVFKLLIGALLMSPVSPPGDFLLSNATKESKKAWPRHPAPAAPGFVRSIAAPRVGVHGPSLAHYASRGIHAARPSA